MKRFDFLTRRRSRAATAEITVHQFDTRSSAFRVALPYLFLSAVWILLSDRLLATAVVDPTTWLRIQSIKGALFVLGSALLIYHLVRRTLSAVAMAETMRRKRERQFQALIENLSEAVTLLRPDGTVAYVSPAFEQITGFSGEERLGQSAFDRVHPDDLSQTRLEFRRLADTPGLRISVKARLQHRDGTWRTLQLLGENLVENPSIQGIIVTYTDVTERVAMDQQLRESEQRFRLMVEGSEQVFFYEHDPEGRLVYVSPSINKVLGYRPEELSGEPYERLLAGDGSDAEVHRRTRQPLNSGTRSEPYTALTQHRDGRTVSMELVERPIIREGVVVGIQGFARDVTKRVEAEESLRQNEERFRSLIENSSDSVTVLDERGKILFQSSSVRRVTNFEAGDLVGRLASRFVHPDDLPAVRESFRGLLHNPGEPITVEFRCPQETGGVRIIEATADSRLADPVIRGIVVNARDVTASRQMEDQFRQAQKMEAVGRLAGGVAHDFNNILTAITGHSVMVLDTLPGDHRGRGDIEEIRRSAERAANLTRQLLAFSRQQVLRRDIIDLNAAVREMEKMISRLIGEHISLSTDLRPNLSTIQADEGQIQQVIMNLAVNARDAMPAGGDLVISTSEEAVSVEETNQFPFSMQPGGYVVLTVSDTGGGMDQETIDHVFDPFFTTKPQGKGTGLGLSTVYGIVKQSDGYIYVESTPEKGTEFRVYLPRSDGKVDSRQDGNAGEPARSFRPAGSRSGIILLVEDELSVRNLIRRILERGGYKVLEAPDGNEALRLVRDHDGPIDLLLTDVVMPGMGGPELSRTLAHSRPETRTLFMSGYTEDEIFREGMAQAAVDLLEKPFLPGDLLNAIQKSLDSVIMRN